MTPDAIDESFSLAAPLELARAGVKLVCRYLSHTDGKNLHFGEAVALHAAGIGILLNWESSADRALGGAGNGAVDAADAAALAEALGAPHGLTIYYSADVDTNPGEYGAIDAYFRAANEATRGRYLVGVYGEYDLVNHLHQAGLVTSEWQTYAWSHGQVSVYADLLQYLNGQALAGGDVDFNRILHADQLGAWWPHGAAPASTSAVPIPPEETMTILVDQQGHRIGALDQCGRTFTFTGSEWGAQAAVIAKLPADRKPTIVQVTKAQYDALPRVTR